MKKYCLGFLFTSICFLSFAQDGETLYQIKGCQACHGNGALGNQIIGAPQLAGQNKTYLVYQMQQFRSGNRAYHVADQKGKVMVPIALNLKDEEIEILAGYLHQLEMQPQTTPTVFGIPSLGAETYELCAACHGEQAQGIEELFAPSLRGLQDWYLEHQLHQFKNGVRGVDAEKEVFGAGMAAISTVINEGEDLNNLIAYIRFISRLPLKPVENTDSE